MVGADYVTQSCTARWSLVKTFRRGKDRSERNTRNTANHSAKSMDNNTTRRQRAFNAVKALVKRFVCIRMDPGNSGWAANKQTKAQNSSNGM